MLIVISPAKKLDFETTIEMDSLEAPKFLNKSKKIIKEIRKLSEKDIEKLMKISPALAKLNVERYHSFKTPFTTSNSKPAAFAFKGDTYQGLEIETFKKTELNSAQRSLRILSGLYGLLKPLDLIQPYRLEMGTKFGIEGAINLYQVWKEDITEQLNTELKKEKVLVNLASKEYFSAIDFKSLKGEVITPVFKENKNGVYKIVSFSAKRARGMMSQFIIKNKIKTIEQLKEFNMDNYKYNKELSTATEPVFTR